MLAVGKKFKSKNTITNQNCRVPAGKDLWITHVCGKFVSFTIPGCNVDAKMEKGQFPMNFEADLMAPVNQAYAQAMHFNKHYPKDFFNR